MLACAHLAGMNGFLAQLEIAFSCGATLAMMRAEMLSELVTESSTLSRGRPFWDVPCLLFLLLCSVIYLGLVEWLAFLLVAGVEVQKLCCPTRWCPLVSLVVQRTGCSGGPVVILKFEALWVSCKNALREGCSERVVRQDLF